MWRLRSLLPAPPLGCRGGTSARPLARTTVGGGWPCEVGAVRRLHAAAHRWLPPLAHSNAAAAAAAASTPPSAAPTADGQPTASGPNRAARERADLVRRCASHQSAKVRLDACNLLLSRHQKSLGSPEYALVLKCMLAPGSGVSVGKAQMVWRTALNGGFLRDYLRTSHTVLQAVYREGRIKEVLDSFRLLQRAARQDHIDALREQRESTIHDDVPLAYLDDGDLLTEAAESTAVHHATSQVLHLDRRIYHLAIEAHIARGEIDQALALVTSEMPHAAKMVAVLPHGPAWSAGGFGVRNQKRKENSDTAEIRSGSIRASMVEPSTLTFLLITRAAFERSQYELSRNMMLRAWNEAERDWSMKERSVRAYLELLWPGAPAMPLSHLPDQLYRQVCQLQQSFASRVGTSDSPLPPMDRRFELEPLPDTDPLFFDVKHLTGGFSALDDFPSFTHITVEDIWRFQWSCSVLARLALLKSTHGATAATLEAIRSSGVRPSFEAELAQEDAATQTALKVMMRYARHSTWVRSWFLGQLPHSLHDTSLLSSSAPSPHVKRATDLPLPPSNSPTAILHQNPSASLEILFRLLANQRAYHGIAQFYLGALLPAYEETNQALVRRLIEEAEVESIDTPTGALPPRLQSSQRLRFTSQLPDAPQAIFTVATVPPGLLPHLPPLSPLVLDVTLNALSKLASVGMCQNELLQLLESRAYINTLYTHAPATPGSVFALHADGALNPSHLISVLHTLSPSAWQLTKQITEQVFKGILLPCLEHVERSQLAFTAGHHDAEGVPRVFHIESPATRAQSQSIFAHLMARYFGVRKYAPLILVLEMDHALQFSPPLPLTIEQSLHVIQAYTWIGNLSSSLELLQEFLPTYTGPQKVCILAFMCHFLETHIIKSIKQAARRQELGGSAGAARQATTSSHVAAAAQPSPSLPASSMLPMPSMSSGGSPVLSLTGGPAYNTKSGFTIIENMPDDATPIDHPHSIAHRPRHSTHLDEAEWEVRKVESWKRQMARILAADPQRRHDPRDSADPARVSSSLFDDAEFLQVQSPHRRAGGSVAPGGQSSYGFLPNRDAPQSGTFSFGMGSPAFSSYATNTSTLALTANAGQPELDPLITYQLSQIHGLLDQLLGDPSCLHYDASSRVCDLRAGVSYNRGRCILYLMSLWIKCQSGDRHTYSFLVPRSLIKQKAAGVWCVSDLEHVMLHSYSAEYLFTQYFPHDFDVVTVEGRPAGTIDHTTSEQHDEAHGHVQKDAFGRPVSEQAYAVFTVQWP